MSNGTDVGGLNLSINSTIEQDLKGADTALDLTGKNLLSTAQDADALTAAFLKQGAVAQESADKVESASARMLSIEQKRDVELNSMRWKAAAEESKVWDKHFAEMDRENAVFDSYIGNKEAAWAKEMNAYNALIEGEILASQKQEVYIYEMLGKREAASVAAFDKEVAAYYKKVEAQIELEQKRQLIEYEMAGKVQAAKEAGWAKEMIAYDKTIKAEIAAKDAAVQAEIALAEKQAIADIKFSEMTLKAKIKHLEELKAYQAAPSISSSTVDDKFSSAAQSALPQLTAMHAEYNAAAKLSHQSTDALGNALDGYGGKVLNSKAKTELLVLAHEGLQGQFKRFIGSLFVMAEYTNTSGAIFTALGGAVIAVGAAFVYAGYEMLQGAIYLDKLEKGLILTSNAAGLTRDSLEDMGQRLANGVTGGAGKAITVLEALAASGKVSSENISATAEAALNYSHLTGESAQKSAELFEGMSKGVAKWAEKNNESFHYLSVAQYLHIDLLERQGNKQEALSENLKAFNAATDDHKRNVGTLVQLYRDWADIFDRINHGLKQLGAGPTTGQQLNTQVEAALKLREKLEGRGVDLNSASAAEGPYRELVTQYGKMLTDIKGLRDKADKEKLDAKLASGAAESNLDAIQATKELNALTQLIRSKKEKRLDAIAEVDSNSVNANAGKLATELAAKGVSYKELIEVARNADAKITADQNVGSQIRVGNKENEFQKQLELAKQYGIKLIVDADKRAGFEQAVAEKYTDRKVKSISDGRKQELLEELSADKAQYDQSVEAVNSNRKLLDNARKTGLISDESYYASLAAGTAAQLESLEREKDAEVKVLKKYKSRSDTEVKEIQKRLSDVANAYELAKAKITDQGALDTANSKLPNIGERKLIASTILDNADTAKLNDATSSTLAYGVVIKSTALALAEASIAQTKSTGSVKDSVSQNFLAAAAAKDIASANAVFAKEYVSLVKEKQIADNAAKDGFIGVETAKVDAAVKTTRALLTAYATQQDAAYAAQQAAGGGTATADQQAAYQKAVALRAEISSLFENSVKVKFEIAGIKDLGTQFEKIGAGMGKLGDSWKKASEAMTGMGKGIKEVAKAEEDQQKGIKGATADRIGAYGDMADAAAQFFDKQSSGYKALEGISKAFHAAEIVLQTIAMARSAVAAVLKAAEQYGWYGMAAMAAAVAALGFSVGGGGGGGGGPPDAASRQASAGTGSILDDPNSKSESIKNAIEYVGKVSSNVLSHTISMDNSLKTLVENIKGFTSLIVQGGANGEIKNVNNQATNPLEKGLIGSLRSLDVVGVALDKLFGTKLSNSLFGGKTTTTDTGLNFASGTVGSIASNGVSGNQYQDTKLSGGLFHSDKYNTLTQSLSPEITGQFSKVIGNIADSVKLASGLVGLSGDTFTAKLNSFVVNIGAISTKGLTGDQIQKQFETIFSKLGDDLAKFATAGSLNLLALAKAGEGSFQTLIRVATDLTTVNGMFQALGFTLLKVDSSGVNAAESLVSAFGGLDKFAASSDNFAKNFYSEGERTGKTMDALKVAFKDLGVAMPVDRAQFRATVEAAAAKQDWVLVASLMKLGDTFASVVPAVEDVNAAIQTVALTAKQTTDFNIQIMELEGNKSGALAARRAQEISTMDAAGQAIMRRIYLLQDESAIAQQGYGLDTQILQLKGDTAKLRERELALLEPANRAKQNEIWALQDKAAADAKAAQADQAAAAAATQAAQQAEQAAKQITAAWQSITDSLFKEVQRIRGLISGDSNVGYGQAQSQFAIATAQARAGDQDAAKLLPQLSQTLLQLAQQNVSSLQELNLIRAQTAQSLSDSATGLAGKYGTVKIPGFASGGDFGGGIRLVGENGPEVEHTGPSRITNASETGGIFGRQDALIKTLTSQVSKLNATVERLVTPTVANEKNTRKMKDNIQRVTRDGEVMYTTTTP